MQDGLAVEEAAQALPPRHIRCSPGQPTLGHASSVSSLTPALDACADMMEVHHSAKYTLCAHVWVAQNLWPTTPGEAVWHAQVRQRLGMAYPGLSPRLTTDSESDTCHFLSELTSSSNIGPVPVPEDLAAVAQEVKLVAPNLFPTTPGEAIWHAHVRQRRGRPFSLWPQVTTGVHSHACDSLSEFMSGSSVCPLPCEGTLSTVATDVTPEMYEFSELMSSSNNCPLPLEDNLAAVAQEVTPVPQNLSPTSPGEAIWRAHVRHGRGRPFSLWPQVTTGVHSHACDSLSEFIPNTSVCPLPCEGTLSTVATDVTPEILQWAQRWPPALPDNRFARDRTQRTYVCDNCEKRVAWRGQAQGFDGQYWAYNYNSPVASLHEEWERGRDFRWYCTACYATWWNMTDFTEVREALHLEHKTKKRRLRAEHWREHKEV